MTRKWVGEGRKCDSFWSDFQVGDEPGLEAVKNGGLCSCCRSRCKQTNVEADFTVVCSHAMLKFLARVVCFT